MGTVTQGIVLCNIALGRSFFKLFDNLNINSAQNLTLISDFDSILDILFNFPVFDIDTAQYLIVNTMVRKRVRNEIEYEVSAINFKDGKYYVTWSVGGISQEPEWNLENVASEFKELARKNPGVNVLIDVTHIKMMDSEIFVQQESKAGWCKVDPRQLEPKLLMKIAAAPNISGGIELTTESNGDEGCCTFAVMKLFSKLHGHVSNFSAFKFGAASGDFITFLRNSSFGLHRIKPKRIKLTNLHPYRFLSEGDRKQGEKYFLLVKKSHAIGVEFKLTNQGIRGIIYCSLHPEEELDLTWENFKKVGGSRDYLGQIWKLRYESAME